MDIDGFHVYQSGKYDGQGVFHEFTQESVDAMGRCSPIIMNQEKDTGILKVQFNVRYILFLLSEFASSQTAFYFERKDFTLL